MATLTREPAGRFGTVDEPTTGELLARAAAGDADAWGGIVDRFERLVWSVARTFRYDHATTADVVQTVWLRLAERCGEIRDPERLGSWLATACRNEAVSSSRRRRREVLDDKVLERLEARHPPGGDADESSIEDATRAEVLRAFTRLPEPCQQLLRLACADPPLDYRTISDLLGRPLGSIGPSRQRCLDRLRGLMVTADA